ncbi:hypothetical protein [Streptomyces sp. NPDC006446]|uniref:hypothetical protein n=1 Tax=Streptomyces sp. NPDC006446 TaxID=3154301 RepID=UPI0033AF3BB7
MTQYVGGGADTIAGVTDNRRRMYDAKAAPTPSRLTAGGFPCGFEDSSGFGCDSGTSTRAARQKLTQGVTTSYLLHTLRGDTLMCDRVRGPAAQNLTDVAHSAKPRHHRPPHRTSGSETQAASGS